MNTNAHTQVPRYRSDVTKKRAKNCERCPSMRKRTHTHTKPKLINRVGSANEEEELKTKNQRNKQTPDTHTHT